MTRNSDTISPTAHYTAQVWLRNGLSDERLRTSQGAFLWHVLAPAMAASRRIGGPTLQDFLLARHALIDHRLTAAIDRGLVSQVIELGAGLSPRGLRFSRCYGDRINYIEADLPEMAARKRDLLGTTAPHHRIATVNALADDGPDSLFTLSATLDPAQGVAIITEGLLNYFDQQSVLGMWRRFSHVLASFPHGLYLADIHLQHANQGLTARAFRFALSQFVRSRVHFHFSDETEVSRRLLESGFLTGAVLQPNDFRSQIEACNHKWAQLTRIIEATTERS